MTDEAYSERHVFEITARLDRAQLEAHNNEAAKSGVGISVPTDPSEWDERDLTLAIENELVLLEVDSHRAE